MSKFFSLDNIKTYLSGFLIFSLGCSAIIFTVLYLETFEKGILKDYSYLLKGVSVGIITATTIAFYCFFRDKTKIIYKFFFITIFFFFVIALSLYFLKQTNILQC